MTKLTVTLFFAALAVATPSQTHAQFIAGQDLLGAEVVKEKSKRGSVRLRRGGASYSGIVIAIPGNAQVVKRVTVQFEDRSSESFNESRLQIHNGRSSVLWFRSRNQVINKVSLLYFPDAGMHQGTEIRVYGVR